MSECKLLMCLTLLVAAGGCAGSTAATAARVVSPADLQLRIGESAAVEAREGILAIRFEAVIGDSRCPKGEACIWEGDAVVRVALRSDAGAEATRDLHTFSKGPAAADHEGWNILLVALDPQPVTGRTIPREAYVAMLRVAYGATDTGGMPSQ